MADTAVGAPDSPAQLAARYGLRVAGLRPSLVAYTKHLWAYRHFIASFSNARLAASFTTARLGRLWQVLTPLVNAGVYWLIFGVILKTSHGIENFPAYLCTGIFVFNFTQQAVQNGTKSIADNLGLIRAMHFPRACLPLAITLSQLQELVYSMIVLVGIVLITGEAVTLNWLLVIPILVLQTLFNAGLAMAMARMGSKITDLKQVMPFIMRTWLYASGIFYNIASVIGHVPAWLGEILKANPMLIFINLMRYALLDPPADHLASTPYHMWLMAVGWAVVLAVGGYVFFWLGEREYGRG